MSVVEIKGLTKTFPKGNVTALAARTRECLRRSLVRILDEDALSAPTKSEEDLLRR